MSDSLHTQPPSVPVPSINGHQLSGDDYENIWLRIKDRSATTVLGYLTLIVTVVGLLGGVGGYEIARRRLEAEVAQQTQSQEFRDSLTEYTRQQIPALGAELEALEQRTKVLNDTIIGHQQKIAAMQHPPIAVGALGAQWTAPNGRSLRLRTGRVRTSGLATAKVTFEPPFAIEPVVLIALNEAQAGFGRGAIWTTNVTTSGMEINSSGVDGTIQWVAIGSAEPISEP